MTVPVTRAKAYLKVRHKTLRDAIKQLELDGMLLTHTADLTYITNFTGDDSIGLVTPKDIYIVTDFRYKEQLGLEAAWVKVGLREGKMADALVKVLGDAKVGRVGFDANTTTVGQLKALEKVIADEKLRIELVGTENVLLNMRKVKDDHEVDLVRKAIALAEEAFDAVRGEIKAGVSENYLAGLMQLELRSRGAADASFPIIVAAGTNSSLPHYKPGESLIQRDQPVLIDCVAQSRSYCSDLTRTMLLGRVSQKIKRIYGVVLEAQEAAIKFLRPGVTTRQADAVARDVVEKAGFADNFGHGLGHGLGLDVHELPTMRKTGEEEELRPGMIVTVEPGIYLPGEGGVRIEDDVLITHSGCEVLTSVPKALEDCHIE